MDKKDSKNLESIAKSLESIDKSLKKMSAITFSHTINVTGDNLDVRETVKKELDKHYEAMNTHFRQG